MDKLKAHLSANWRRYALALGSAGAAYYGGPAGYSAAQEYLPLLCKAAGLC